MPAKPPCIYWVFRSTNRRKNWGGKNILTPARPVHLLAIRVARESPQKWPMFETPPFLLSLGSLENFLLQGTGGVAWRGQKHEIIKNCSACVRAGRATNSLSWIKTEQAIALKAESEPWWASACMHTQVHVCTDGTRPWGEQRIWGFVPKFLKKWFSAGRNWAYEHSLFS